MTAKSSKGERKRLREQETSVYGSAQYVVYPERENEGGKTP